MDVDGAVTPGLEPVRDAFAEVVAAQAGTGAALAVRADGRLLVDLWGGAASADGSRRWRADSLVMPYSVSKPFVAVCALLLVQRGLLDLDAPVQRYWPRFAAPATVRDVLAHRTGVVALPGPASTELLYDWAGVCAQLERAEPAWPPGAGHGENALFYGHLVGELVRRVDGRMPGDVLREEVCGPLGLDAVLGLTDAEQARTVELTGLGEAFVASALEGRPELFARAFHRPPGVQDAAVVNGAAWRAAQVPAVNVHLTAAGLAGFYAALTSGRLLDPGLLREATTVHAEGPDLVLGSDSCWGLGLALDEDGFGMGGIGGSMGWASTAGGYEIGFVTGSMDPEGGADAVEGALRSCLGLPPLPD